ncbi:MAG: hypothetical protein II453_01875 [Alphaproteobacteria bacterium]|nr:hypothetical protein [Alphaproteobacteria bacterium]
MIQYNEEKHEYTLDGKVVPSVTELAKKFSGLDTTWLQAHPEFAERGTIMHNQLADWFTNGTEPTDEKAIAIAGKIVSIPERQQCEVLVYNEALGYAGTADMIVKKDKTIQAIIDFKSSDNKSVRNRNYYTCQLNLYRLALESMGADVSNVQMVVVNPKATHYIPVMTWEEMQELASVDPLDDELSDLEEELITLEGAHARYEAVKAELTEKLKAKYDGKEGHAAGVYYTFTCTQPSQRKTFDQNKAREIINDDDAFEACYRVSTVSPSVRIKLKGEE